MTEEKEVCPTCKGVGHVPRKVALAFPIGCKVLCAAAVGSEMAVAIVEGALDLHTETHVESAT